MDLKLAKILVVDDDEIQRSILKKIAENEGCQLRLTDKAGEARRLAREWKPDIILLDIYLPDGNGIELLNELRENENHQNTIIILMSADRSEQTIVSGLLRKANEFISKPIPVVELVLKMQNLLELKRAREELELLNSRLLQEKQLFSRYFSNDVVERIVNGDLHSKLEGEMLEASVLFFDIRNFTTLSESLQPNQVADFLNRIFSDIMDVIFANGGSVNKMMGDAILATFGCPETSPNDARNALNCALAIEDIVHLFNEGRPGFIKNDIECGTGIATGQLFAGNVGSYRRMEYTVIGDVVNVAARLQELTKKATVRIIIDGRTLELAGDEFKVQKIRLKNVRGKNDSISMYALKGRKDDQKSVTFF